DDVVMDATTVSLVERVTRLEDAFALTAAVVETHTEQLAALTVIDEVQQGEIEAVAEEVAVQEMNEAAEEAPEETEPEREPEPEPEPTPRDELPTVREHMWFRKWGRK